MLTSSLFLGLLIGMQHALEADHVAAVASIAARQTSVRRIVAHGAVWGLGHTLTLMAVAGGAVVLGRSLDGAVQLWLETGVGVMLVGLGVGVLVRLWRERIHIHVHRHGDGHAHVHAHSHKGDEARAHDANAHAHAHPRGVPVRSLMVGMMHGMAGSAALLVLTASSVADSGTAIVYIVLFGLGSVVGMALLSAAIAVPLARTAALLTWGHRAIHGGIGAGTAAFGLYVVAESLPL